MSMCREDDLNLPAKWNISHGRVAHSAVRTSSKMPADNHRPHIYLPCEDEETAEQIAYEKETLNCYSYGHVHDGDGVSEGEPILERSVEGPSSSEQTGGGLMGQIKDFVKDLKPTVQATIDLFSLESRLARDLDDPTRFPEITQQATVRRGLDLCPEELDFLAARKTRVREQFARYIGVAPSEVHLDDVPTVALGGSGGGYRAMLALLGYSLAMRDAGLWDLLTYVAGVSGSCWAIAAYFTFGRASLDAVVAHCKMRLSPHHPLSPDAVRRLLGSAGGHYETLGPLLQKSKSGLHTVPMDFYAVFTTGYLFMQDSPAIPPDSGTTAAAGPKYHRPWWKWTHAQSHLRDGSEPFPILTAIRHERPWKDWADESHPFEDANPRSKEHQEAVDAWWQWFEITPYEVGCDELEAWCPTWGFGRQFAYGKSVSGLPEQSLALLLGLCTSAPAGPLSSYLATIQRNLPKNLIGNTVSALASGIAAMWGKQDTEVFTNHHPLHASNEHNFLFHITPTSEGTPKPPGIENSPRVHLLDSGMDNNCPTVSTMYP